MASHLGPAMEAFREWKKEEEEEEEEEQGQEQEQEQEQEPDNKRTKLPNIAPRPKTCEQEEKLVRKLVGDVCPGGFFRKNVYKAKRSRGIPMDIPLYKIKDYRPVSKDYRHEPELLIIPLAEYLVQTYGKEYFIIDLDSITKVSYNILDMDKIRSKDIESLEKYLDHFSKGMDDDYYIEVTVEDLVADYEHTVKVIGIMKGEEYLNDNVQLVKSPELLNHGSDEVYAANLKLWIKEQHDKAHRVINEVGNGGNMITCLDEIFPNVRNIMSLELEYLITVVKVFIPYDKRWKELVSEIDNMDRGHVIKYLTDYPISARSDLRPEKQHDGNVTIDNLKDMKMEELRQFVDNYNYMSTRGGAKAKRKRTKKKKKRTKKKNKRTNRKKRTKKIKRKRKHNLKRNINKYL